MIKRLLAAGVIACLFSSGAMAANAACPNVTLNQLRSRLKAAVSAARGNLGLGLNMWATVVAADGTVCLVANSSGDAIQGQWLASRDVEYLHVRAEGRFEGQDNFYFAVDDAGPGYHVYTPLRTASGQVLLVNRGYIADTRLPPEGQNYSRPAGEVTRL